ncbi:MAG: transporter substrate-binding domain-containing protein [Deltaproteobacteria bacterium]|nr:transporter substrate-binding domain-containing protein [Deltaproteobacteria bacterium]
MLRKIILIVIILIMAGQLVLWADTGKTYKVAVDHNYPPFSLYNRKTASIEGLAVDVTKVICEHAQIQCDFVLMSHEESLKALKAGEVDIVCSGPGLMMDRKANFLTTAKFFRSSSVFVGVKQVLKQLDKNDFTGLAIGVVQGSIQHQRLSSNYERRLDIKEYERFQDVLTALALQEIDLGMLDILAVYYAFQNDKAMMFDVIGNPVNTGDGAFLAVRGEEKELLKKLNEGIFSVHYTREFEIINAKYYDFFIF